MTSYQKMGVIGGGAWGTALAQTLAVAGRDVCLWAFEEDCVRAINEQHENTLFLPGVPLSKNIKAAVTLACADEAVGKALVKAIASPTFRPYLSQDVLGAEIGGPKR